MLEFNLDDLNISALLLQLFSWNLANGIYGISQYKVIPEIKQKYVNIFFYWMRFCPKRGVQLNANNTKTFLSSQIELIVLLRVKVEKSYVAKFVMGECARNNYGSSHLNISTDITWADGL